MQRVLNLFTGAPGPLSPRERWQESYGPNAERVVHRGLDNPTAAHNCFLNVILQGLWHLAPFRQTLRDGAVQHSHALDKPCMTCALRGIYAFYEYAEDEIIPPDQVRAALADLHAARAAFRMGEMADAAETIDAIFNALHMEALNAAGVVVPPGMDAIDCACEPLCPAHAVFGTDYFSWWRCGGCGISSDPVSARTLTYPVYVMEASAAVKELMAEAASASAHHGASSLFSSLQHPGKLLFGAGDEGSGDVAAGVDGVGCVSPAAAVRAGGTHFNLGAVLSRIAARDARQSLSIDTLAKLHSSNDTAGTMSNGCRTRPPIPERYCLSLPRVFCASLVWPSDECSKEEVASMMSLLGQLLDLRQLFRLEVDGWTEPSAATPVAATAADIAFEQQHGFRETNGVSSANFNLSGGGGPPPSDDDASAAERASPASSSPSVAAAAAPASASPPRLPHAASRGNVYRLRCVVCYYGKHYVTFIASERFKQWLLFDDNRISSAGEWPGVVRRCVDSKYQPTLLFYEQMDTGAPVYPSTGATAGAAAASGTASRRQHETTTVTAAASARDSSRARADPSYHVHNSSSSSAISRSDGDVVDAGHVSSEYYQNATTEQQQQQQTPSHLSVTSTSFAADSPTPVEHHSFSRLSMSSLLPDYVRASAPSSSASQTQAAVGRSASAAPLSAAVEARDDTTRKDRFGLDQHQQHARAGTHSPLPGSTTRSLKSPTQTQQQQQQRYPGASAADESKPTSSTRADYSGLTTQVVLTPASPSHAGAGSASKAMAASSASAVPVYLASPSSSSSSSSSSSAFESAASSAGAARESAADAGAYERVSSSRNSVGGGLKSPELLKFPGSAASAGRRGSVDGTPPKQSSSGNATAASSSASEEARGRGGSSSSTHANLPLFVPSPHTSPPSSASSVNPVIVQLSALRGGQAYNSSAYSGRGGTPPTTASSVVSLRLLFPLRVAVEQLKVQEALWTTDGRSLFTHLCGIALVDDRSDTGGVRVRAGVTGVRVPPYGWHDPSSRPSAYDRLPIHLQTVRYADPRMVIMPGDKLESINDIPTRDERTADTVLSQLIVYAHRAYTASPTHWLPVHTAQITFTLRFIRSGAIAQQQQQQQPTWAQINDQRFTR